MKRWTALAFLIAAFGADGAVAQVRLGGEIQVNTFTTAGQTLRGVASGSNGDIVVVWDGVGASHLGAFARKYDASGVPITGEIPVDTSSTGALLSSVAADAAGDFVVVWVHGDGSLAGVFGRRFDASGIPRGPQFLANTYTTDAQSRPAVGMDAAGDFVVAWDSFGQDGHGPGIFARRYDSFGEGLGPEFQVNTYTTDTQSNPSVALARWSGDSIIAWMGCGAQDESDCGIFVRHYSATGVPFGPEFQVNTYTIGCQQRPSVAADDAGFFVVAWESFSPSGGWDIFARRYDPAATPLGPEFRVNTFTSRGQYAPTVAVGWDGYFLITWTGEYQDGSGSGVFGQRFDPAGQRIGGEFRVNSYTINSQYFSHATLVGGSDRFFVAWSSNQQDGDFLGAFAQAFAGSHGP